MTASLSPNQVATSDTNTISVGSLCTGYAGLDMGVATALGANARLLWTADNDPRITHLLTHRFPDVPNLSDLAAVRWPRVQRPEVVTAGFPCQEVSTAGTGAGIKKGTHSSVLHYVIDTVRHLRPHLLVLENVAALRWKGRGLDRVLSDLARVGYDASWCCVRASDIGAPHRRERIFVAAHPVRQRRTPRPGRPRTAYAARTTGAGVRCAVPSAPHARVRTNMHCAHHRRAHPLPGKFAAHTAGQRCHQRQTAADRFTRAPHAALCGHRYDHRRPGPETARTAVPFAYSWGNYGPAIRRWEKVLGAAAPVPTEIGTRGQPWLSAALVEWMMGLLQGWGTDPSLALPRSAQLQALGNGMVPQQAAAAVRHLLDETISAESGGAAWG